MKKLLLKTIGFLAVSALCSLPCVVSAADAPVFSLESGIYVGKPEVTITGENVYYTTDGSLPTTSSTKYTEAIRLSQQTKTLTQWSGSQSEALTVPQATVIRAASIVNGVSSDVVTRTYFVGSDIVQPLGNIPLVSLVVTPYDLWDSSNGIYTNYSYEHKVPAVIQHIDTSGNLAYDKSIDIKVSGNGSRNQAKKALRIYTEKKKPIKYDLIPGTTKNYLDSSSVQEFYKVTFRISDWTNTNLRDVVAQKLAEFTRVDTANSAPVALFLNGEYWGLYECREQYDNKYIASHYDIDDDDVVFFDRDWTLSPQYDKLSDTGTVYIDKLEYSEGPADNEAIFGESYYRDQWRYVQSLVVEQDITDPAVYSEFCANVDIDNFIDYLIVYIFCANDDWPGNNFKFWRITENKIDPDVYGADGKWRFMVHDFDIAFESRGHDTLRLSAVSTLNESEARHPEFATRLLGGLLKNKSFRNELAQRTLAYGSTYMGGESMNAIINKLVSERESGKYADMMRWNLGTFNNRINVWKDNVAYFETCATDRGGRLKTMYIDLLNTNYNAGISGSATVTTSSADRDYQISGVMLKPDNGFTVQLFSGIPAEIEAEGAKITVSSGSDSYTGLESLSFSPKNGNSYTLTITERDPYISADGSEVLFSSKDEATAVFAYYSDDGSLSSVTTHTFCGDYVAEAKAHNGTIKAMLWGENIRPLCESVTLTAAEPKAVGIARAGRFAKLSLGEIMPVFVFDEDGNRIDADISVEGGVASYKSGLLTATTSGSGRLVATENGKTIYADIVVD